MCFQEGKIKIILPTKEVTFLVTFVIVKYHISYTHLQLRLTAVIDNSDDNLIISRENLSLYISLYLLLLPSLGDFSMT